MTPQQFSTAVAILLLLAVVTIAGTTWYFFGLFWSVVAAFGSTGGIALVMFIIYANEAGAL